MDGMDFLRLCDCAQSTRLGMADRGFPKTMLRLAAKGLVSPVEDGHKWPGYKVTTLGLERIREKLREGKVGRIVPRFERAQDEQ